MNPVIDVSDVCFAYGAQEVLHNIAFRVDERDMVAIVGPNGGGKTTLLMLLLGLVAPRLGSIRVFGESPVAARRRIGYVPQHLHFDPRFPVTALDVVCMGRVDRRLIGPYRRSDLDAAMAALEQVELAHLARRAFAELSGGESQRVLVAQALVTEPRLLLMDEPTANVDAVVEHRLYELFDRLNERLPIVFVSHNLTVVTHHVSHVLCVNRTAEMHPIEDIAADVFQAAQGGNWALLKHDATCHVVDSSDVLASPHSAEHGEA